MSTAAGVDDLVEGLDQLVRPDGAHFELTRWDAPANTLHLRLVFDDEGCADCIVPRKLLQSITLDRARQARLPIVRVEIDDPREHE